MPHAERIPFSWAGGGSWVKHVAVVVVASMVHCRDQHSVFVSHLGEKVESCCKELPLPLLIDLPRLLHLLCAGSHSFLLVTHIITTAAGFAAVSHYCFL